MATGKPNSRNWNDVQLAIVSIALALTFILWNVFAGPDRARAQDQSSAAAATAIPTAEPTAIALPSALPPVKIIFGETAPSSSPNQVAAQPTKKPRGGGGGGTGGS